MQKPTARRIADLAQVSPSTVSRILNGTAQVSPQLRARVLEAAQHLGYPLLGKHSDGDTICLLVPQFTNPFYMEIIDGVVETATNAGLNIVLCSASGGGLLKHPMLRGSSNPPAGIISLCRLQKDTPFLQSLPENTPIVQCCEYDTDLPYPVVAINNYAAAFHATSHLIGLGHTRLSIFNSTCHTLYGKERERGFRAALAAHNLSIPEDWVLHLGEIDYNLAAAAAHDLFSQPTYPEAVFCVSDVYAAGIVKSVRALGLQIPEDISVIGFDDTEIALINEPALTTVRQPRRKLGVTACNVIIRMIRTGSSPSQFFWIESDLVVRSSTSSKSAPSGAAT